MPSSLIIEQFDPFSISLFAKHIDNSQQQTKKSAPVNPDVCASDVFIPFSLLPWAMLLHSGNSQHENSRFDIIVANPIASICTIDKISTITDDKGNVYQIEKDPLLWIKQAVADYLTKQKTNSSLPFLGGALGCFSYDLGAHYEVLPHQAIDDMGTPELAVGIYDWAIIKDNHRNIWQFVSHRLTFEQVIDNTSKAYKAFLPKPANFKINDDWVSNLNQAQYEQRFIQVQEYLKSGDCYQINLAQRFTNRYQGNEYQAFKQLLAANNSPFSAYLNLDNFKVLSVSPERLLHLNDGSIESKPIKGTIKRVDDTKENQRNIKTLQESVKDRAENVMIVDLLRNDIGRVSKAGSVKVPRLFAIESFPAVHHLVSTVTGELKPQLHSTDLLRAAFPGGSITGAPKLRAMEIIDELEPHRRSIYCGSIGYICCSGNMDTSITIRTLLCKDDKIHAWAGGGIVADSTWQSEYQETFAKVDKILPVLVNM